MTNIVNIKNKGNFLSVDDILEKIKEEGVTHLIAAGMKEDGEVVCWGSDGLTPANQVYLVQMLDYLAAAHALQQQNAKIFTE